MLIINNDQNFEDIKSQDKFKKFRNQIFFIFYNYLLFLFIYFFVVFCFKEKQRIKFFEMVGTNCFLFLSRKYNFIS